MYRILRLPACLLLSGLFVSALADSVADVAAAPAGRLDDLARPTGYRIELTIDPDAQRFAGTTEIDVVLAAPAERLWLHGKDLDVDGVTVVQPGRDAVSASYREVLPSGVSLVSFAVALDAGPATLRFEYSAEFGENLFGLFKVSRDGKHYIATQFQPLGARRAFPSFDEPAFKVPFDITLIVPAEHAAVTTTNEKSIEELANGFLKYEFHRTRPLPTYLIAIAVGPYDVNEHAPIAASEYRQRPVPLRGLASAGSGARLDVPLAGTQPMLTLLENYFGLPYPYRKMDLIAVPASFGGAMENVGAIVYDEWLLMVDDESSVSQRRWYVLVHAHELAHQWFGNLVTPAWWDDIWLNESFADWIAFRTGQDYWPDGGFDRWLIRSGMYAMANDSVSSAQPIQKSVVTNDDIDSAFDSITYLKGGMVLAMFERYLGEETFRSGVRRHLIRFEDDIATATDFFESLAAASGDSRAIEALRRYVAQPGIPLIDVEIQCRNETPARLEIRQTRYAPLGSRIEPDALLWMVPMCAAVEYDGSRTTHCHLIDGRTTMVDLPTDACPDAVHPNTGSSGYYRFNLSAAHWDTLIERLGTMSALDALSVGDSLRAAFRAGRVSADLYARGIVALLLRDEWDLVYLAIGEVESLLKTLDVEQLRRVQPRLRAVARSRMDAFADGGDVNAVLMRRQLSSFLVELDDPELLELLASRAASYVGFGSPADPSTVEADQLEAALEAGVRVLGDEFHEHLMAQTLASSDSRFRFASISALAAIDGEPGAQRLYAAILNEQIKGNEILGLLFARFDDAGSRDATFEWLSKNAPRVLDLLPEAFRGARFVPLGSSFCHRRRVQDWQDLVSRHAELLVGYRQPLSEALEAIEICAALRNSSADEVVAAFGA